MKRVAASRVDDEVYYKKARNFGTGEEKTHLVSRGPLALASAVVVVDGVVVRSRARGCGAGIQAGFLCLPSGLALFVSHQGCRPVFSSACRRILYCTVVYCNQVTSYSTYVLSFLPSRRCRVHHRQRLLLPKPSYSKLHVGMERPNSLPQWKQSTDVPPNSSGRQECRRLHRYRTVL